MFFLPEKEVRGFVTDVDHSNTNSTRRTTPHPMFYLYPDSLPLFREYDSLYSVVGRPGSPSQTPRVTQWQCTLGSPPLPNLFSCREYLRLYKVRRYLGSPLLTKTLVMCLLCSHIRRTLSRYVNYL